MLGFKSEHKVIKGKKAKEILSKMIRIQTRQLNQADRHEKRIIEDAKGDEKYKVQWNY